MTTHTIIWATTRIFLPPRFVAAVNVNVRDTISNGRSLDTHSYRGLMGFRGQHPMTKYNNWAITWFMIHIIRIGTNTVRVASASVWQLVRSIWCATFTAANHSSGTVASQNRHCLAVGCVIRKFCLQTPSARNDSPNQCIHKSHLACASLCARSCSTSRFMLPLLRSFWITCHTS